MFKPVNQRQSFPELELEILKFWRENDTFRRSIDNRKDAKEYTFYDGPPFATGLPHYGHILAGTIKDVIPRYQTMRGYRIERRFGWDCHGLPVENLIEKELNLSDKDALVEYGIGNFNEACRASVLRYANEWEEVVERMGRWVDFQHDYKTMDPEFMESVWWVFDQLWQKDLVYEGHKPMHICPRCVTPLSNFEVNLGYKDVQDNSVIWKFKLKEEDDTYFLAWTTTPWSTLGVMGLSVNPEFTYLKVKVGEEKFIFVKERLEFVMGKIEDYEVLEEISGKDLVGIAYKHIAPEYKNNPVVQENENVYHTFAADYVENTAGTGIVTINGAYGEIDMEATKKNELPILLDVDMDGNFNKHAGKYAGQYIKDGEKVLIRDKKAEGLVWRAESFHHSYPHCWRCDTPLLNYATSSWFVKVEEIKQTLLDNNQKIHWVPDHLKNGRFGKWLEGARDWAISRTRYWGTPLPIWRCDNEECKHTESLGSVTQLEEKIGEKVVDIHKHFVDDLSWDCPNCAGKMKRIAEVFDCWFESGSMPYAQKHYPFAYNRKLKNTYYLLRHGEGEHNVNGLISCDPEYGCSHTNLTEKGRAEVQKNVAIFRDIKVDIIYSSDFLRTKQTAEILNKVAQTEVVYDERLREFNVGEFQGKDVREYESAFPKKEEKWVKSAKGGETYQDIEDRMSSAFNEYEEKHEGKTVVIVSHGDPLKILLGYLNAEFKKITAYAHCPKVGVPQKIDLKTEEDFQAQYPADFIAEGLDQTRGWFYTLHVLGVALFGQNAYQNVITNGIVLAEDGQKMSKSKQNYPDPNLVFENYGADAMRFYLMNSPVVKADDLRFSEHGVNEVVKGMILPLWNAYAFFVTYANIDGWSPATSRQFQVASKKIPLSKGNRLAEPGGLRPQDFPDNSSTSSQSSFAEAMADKADISQETNKSNIKVQVRDIEPASLATKKSNKLDQWILSALNELIQNVTDGMENYDLQKAASPIFKFIDDLTNWYIRRSRRRFWKSENDTDKDEAYATLYEVLLKTSQVIAPFMPFVAEEIYQNLSGIKNEKLKIKNELQVTENNTNSIRDSELVSLNKGETEGLKPQRKQGITDIVQESNEANSKVQVVDVEPTVFVNSVHLTDWPQVDENLLNADLNAEMAAIQQIVKLGLAARAKAKIKVRQPLPKIQLALSEKYNLQNLESEFDVVREELNIKEIEVIENAEEIAQVMASPNARLLGPKYGKGVQNIICEAKSGNFEKLENGNYKILDFEVLPEEIEIVYQGKEGFNVEADQGLVVALDTQITEELKQEGIARELVRYIQDMRKEADFNVDARIELFVSTESGLVLNVLKEFENYVKTETLTQGLSFKKEGEADLEKEFEIEGGEVVMGVKAIE